MAQQPDLSALLGGNLPPNPPPPAPTGGGPAPVTPPPPANPAQLANDPMAQLVAILLQNPAFRQMILARVQAMMGNQAPVSPGAAPNMPPPPLPHPPTPQSTPAPAPNMPFTHALMQRR